VLLIKQLNFKGIFRMYYQKFDISWIPPPTNHNPAKSGFFVLVVLCCVLSLAKDSNTGQYFQLDLIFQKIRHLAHYLHQVGIIETHISYSDFFLLQDLLQVGDVGK
jgi:hypothetical protein